MVKCKMRIKEANAGKVVLPFAAEFSHSLRKRLSVTNVLVVLKGDDGRILGCGEGAPRSYVTGETPETMIANINKLVKNRKFPWELDDVGQVWDYIDALPGGKEMNASVCALEMALLDAIARDQKRHIIDFFPHDYYTPSIIYGAAIPLSSEDIVKNVCYTIKKLGINRLKLKMGKEYSQNRALLEILAEIFSDGYDLKVDVNGVWNKNIGISHIPLMKEYGVKVIEQPMSPCSGDISAFFNKIVDQNIVLMADESACSIEDAEKICREGYYGMVNIRLSKCGGLRRALRIIRYLRSMGIAFQIGCQLGESGLLSAAGRILCLLCSDAVYYDGSYDALLLAENVTKEDVSFEYGGIAYPLDGIGLGVNIDPLKIKRLSIHSFSRTR